MGAPIDRNKWKPGQGGEFFAIKSGEEHEVCFVENSLEEGTREIDDSTSGEKKVVDCLKLYIDWMDGKWLPKPILWSITSKRAAQMIFNLEDKKVLYGKIISIGMQGDGFQTTYQMMPIADKPVKPGQGSGSSSSSVDTKAGQGFEANPLKANPEQALVNSGLPQEYVLQMAEKWPGGEVASVKDGRALFLGKNAVLNVPGEIDFETAQVLIDKGLASKKNKIVFKQTYLI